MQKSKCFFFKLGFTPCKAQQPLQEMELQEKEAQKDSRIQELPLERAQSIGVCQL